MADEASSTSLAPIIIKRIKKGGHGHHGGAWKVAYADFVTAMMAFFLLLWLINVTSPEQKMGLAEYFMPTIGIKDSMGIGFKGGKKQESTKGRSSADLTAPGLVVGQVKQGPVAGSPEAVVARPDPNAESTSTNEKANESAQDAADTTDSETFKSTAEEVKQALQQDPDVESYKDDVIVEDTPEGLKIDIIDDAKKPMFIPGTATLTDMGKKVLDSMSGIVIKTPNNIMLKGHTDSSGATVNPQYTNWELSADRANAARRFLITTQMEPDRVMKVIGLADRELLTPSEPSSPRNRRVTLILMRGSYFRDPKTAPNTRAIISVADPKPKVEEKPPEPPKEEEKPIGTSMFNPANAPAKEEIPLKEQKPGAEERPELNLPSPKPASAPKAAPEPTDSKKTPVNNGASIFNPAAAPEQPLKLKPDTADMRPELNLPAPKPANAAPKPQEAAPVKKSAIPSGSIFDPAQEAEHPLKLPTGDNRPT